MMTSRHHSQCMMSRGDSYGAADSGSSSSSASNSPHASGRSTPLPADSSRDDLAALSPSPSVSRSNASHMSQSTMSPSSRPVSNATSMVFSKLLDEPATRQHATNIGAGGTVVRSDSLHKSSASPAPQPTSAGSGGQSLLRAVPSLPGRNTSSTILPSSSSVVRASDSFNNGVMAHLNQQMMFTMPSQPKRPMKPQKTGMQNRMNNGNANGHANGAVAIATNGTNVAKNPSDDSSSICPSTSGSESNSQAMSRRPVLYRHRMRNNRRQRQPLKIEFPHPQHRILSSHNHSLSQPSSVDSNMSALIIQCRKLTWNLGSDESFDVDDVSRCCCIHFHA